MPARRYALTYTSGAPRPERGGVYNVHGLTLVGVLGLCGPRCTK